MKNLPYKSGWTKSKVMEQVKKYNNGTCAIDDIGCLYRASDGNRCVIGAFIPDGHKALDFVGPVDDLLEFHPDLVDLMPFSVGVSLRSFQSVHDNSCNGNQDNRPVYKELEEFLEIA